jgi:hypothetical protein
MASDYDFHLRFHPFDYTDLDTTILNDTVLPAENSSVNILYH